MTGKTTKSYAAHSKDAQWGKDPRPYLAYRDLAIKDGTEGKVLARIIRADQPFDGPTGYHSHALDFQMVYLFSGWARLYFEDIGEIRMEAGDAWYQPPGINHEVLDYSDDWQVLEITMPAKFETHDDVR